MSKFLCALFLLLAFTSSSQLKNYVGMAPYVVEDDSMYTYEMIRADLEYFRETYPEKVHPVHVGKSEYGLDLLTIRIGDKTPKKNCVFFVGNIHAREDFSSKLVMKFTNVFLINLEGQDTLYPNARKLLDSLDIYIMPVANPDGLKIAQMDFKGIEDSFALHKDSILLIETYAEWKANGLGIDINTTFDDGNHHLKKGPTFHSVRASEGFKGTTPAEPIETKCIQRFIHEKQPLITASFHTKGNIIFWADKRTHLLFKDIDTKINSAAASASGFKLAGISSDPVHYGCGLENYVRARYGLIGSCVELSAPHKDPKKKRQQHPDNQFNALVWKFAWKIPYIYLENAVLYGNQIREISKEYMQNASSQ